MLMPAEWTAPLLHNPDLSDAADMSSAALIVLGPACVIAAANAEAASIAGHTAMLGARFCEAFEGQACDPSVACCKFAAALSGSERRRRPRWATIHLHAGPTRVLLESKSVSLAGRYINDERQEYGATVTMLPEHLLGNAARYYQQMFAGAIHDLRDAAAVQQLALDILLRMDEAPEPASTAQIVKILQKSTGHLVWYLKHVLDQTLFDLDRISLVPSLVQLRPLLVQIRENLAPLLARRLQTVRIACRPDVYAWVDYRSLDHMITNLIINACNYSIDEDTLVVAARQHNDGATVELSVRDHGPGLSPSEHRSLFDGFSTAPPKPGRGSTGIGLATVRSMAHRQNGAVGVRTPRGSGAYVWIRLPSTPSDNRHDALTNATSHAVATSTSTTSALSNRLAASQPRSRRGGQARIARGG
jgi:signal transduction histidine kinase